jgi:hypothetical protein
MEKLPDNAAFFARTSNKLPGKDVPNRLPEAIMDDRVHFYSGAVLHAELILPNFHPVMFCLFKHKGYGTAYKP